MIVVPAKDDKTARARDKLRKALASNSLRALDTALHDFQATTGEENVSEVDLVLIQLAHVQNEEIKLQNGAICLENVYKMFTKF